MSNSKSGSNKEISPWTTQIIVAVITLIGVLAGAFVLHIGNINLRKNAIETRQKEATKNLQSQVLLDRTSAVAVMKDIIEETPGKQEEIISILVNFVKQRSSISNRLNYQKKNREKIPDDLKQALNVIKGRTPENDDKSKREVQDRKLIDLSKINLHGVDFQKAQLPGVVLRYSDVTDTVFKGANLKGAFLEKIDLRGSGFESSDLSGANLEKADLSGTDFDRAILEKANLRGANLTGSKITDKQIHTACNWKQAKDNTGRLKNFKAESIDEREIQAECSKIPIFKDK
jgi:uncharacterized protein YjbI with pentapeptide repeats